MKKLNVNVCKNKTIFNVLLAMLLLSINAVYAQTKDQVSYPVKLQIEHAAVSSAAAAPEIKAPEPIIRPVEQASSLPPQTATKKTEKKKSVAVNDDEKPKKTTPKKVTEKQKVPVAPVKQKASAAPTKEKTSTVKPVVATATKPIATEKKNNEKQITPAIQVVPTAALNETSTPAPQNTSRGLVIDSATQAAVAKILDDANNEEENFDAPETTAPAVKANPVSEVAQKNSPLVVSGNKEQFVKEFEDFVESRIAPTVPGLALAIIADGKVKVLEAYGVKKIGGHDDINTETLFRLASVSKTVGSSAAAKLVQDGLVSWDTTITSLLPDVEFSNPRYGNQLTIRHILSQASGLPTHTNDNFIEEGMSFEEVVRRLRYVNFICPPGKCYTYQNVAYSLISPIIHKKTGKTYEQYVEEKLFHPLGMHTASFGLDNLRASNNYTQPHTKTRGGWAVETLNENYYRVNPAAGVNASITDVSRWVLAHMGHNPEVLSPSMLRTLHDKVTRCVYYGARDGVTDIHYGLGWRTFDYRGDKNFVHHGGAVLGFRSEVVFNSELQIGMVMLSNSNRLPGSIIFKFLDAYEDSKQGKRPAAAPLVPVKKAKTKK